MKHRDANKADAPNPAVASLFQCGHTGAGSVFEFEFGVKPSSGSNHSMVRFRSAVCMTPNHSTLQRSATHLVKNNANLRHVQDPLGHGSLANTESYLRLMITDLKEAHARFHPREKA